MGAHFVDLQAFVCELIDGEDVPLHTWGTWEATGETSKVVEVRNVYPFVEVDMDDGSMFEIRIFRTGKRWIAPSEREEAAQAQAKQERVAIRLAKKVDAKRLKRRQAGMQPRAEFERLGLERQRPWIALGMSRATWYRRGLNEPPDDGKSEN